MPPLVLPRSPVGEPPADVALGTAPTRDSVPLSARWTAATASGPTSGCVPAAYVLHVSAAGQVSPEAIPFGSPIFTTRIRSARDCLSNVACAFSGPNGVLLPVPAR